MKLQPRKSRLGFTPTEFILIVAIMVVLAAMLLPALRPARPKRINCVNSLKQVGLAFRQWALDNDNKFPMQVSVTNGGTMELTPSGHAYVPFLVLSNELNTPKILFCPAESRPKWRSAWTFDASARLGPGQIPFTNDHSVSYFVGLDISENSHQTIIAGDDNLAVRGVKAKQGILSLWTNTPISWTNERHVNQGNICFADGSVRQFNDQTLTRGFQASGMATNRLAIP